MEIHRELGKGHNEVIYKDALVVRNEVALRFRFCARKITKSPTRKSSCLITITLTLLSGIKILLEAKAVEKLTDSHIKQVLNYLAASKLRLGQLVNFGRVFARVEKGCLMRTRISRICTNCFEG